MKKVIISLLIVAVLVASAITFTACKDEAKEPVVKLVNVDLSSEQYAFAVKKGDTELKTEVNAFLAAKKTEIDAIMDKYLNATTEQLGEYGNANIKTTPTNAATELVVATNLDFAPFEYTNGNKIAGIDMEIAQLLADYLHKTLVVVHMDFEAVVTSVQTLETYDIGIAGLTISEDRKELVDFTDAYFGTTQVLVTKVADTTFDGLTTADKIEEKLKTLTGDAAKCGGQTATTSQFYVEGSDDLGFAGFENLTFSPYPSAAQAIQDMLNGKIAFVVVDKAVADALIKNFNE